MINTFSKISVCIPGLPGRGTHLACEGWEGTENSHKHNTSFYTCSLFSTCNVNNVKAKTKCSSVTQEHLSRVSGAGLCDITVVHSVAATVTSGIKLARKAEKTQVYIKSVNEYFAL